MLISIDDLVDPDFSTYGPLHSLKKTFLDQDEILVVLSAQNGRDPSKQELCSLSRWIQKTADTRGDINAIVSTLGVMWPTETEKSFKASPILSIDCANAELDESAAIRAGLAKIAASPWHGTLTSRAGNDVAVLIYPEARKKDSFYGTFDYHVVDELQSSFEADVLKPNPELKANWIGDGIFQYHLRKGYEAMPALNLMMSALVIILFRIFLGTFKSSFLFLNLVGWVSLPIYAGMALAGHPLDVLSSSISLMIFISSLEDFLFLSHFMRKWSWRRAFDRVLMPCFFTSLTTVIGFGSLAFADLAIIRRFGIWAAAGAALEWVVLFTILPALMQKFPKLRNWINPKKSVNVRLPKILNYRPRRILTSIALLILPFSLWATGHLHISDSPERLLRADHPARQALNSIEESRGWRGQVSLVFSKYEDEKFNRDVIAQVKTWPLVVQVEDAYAVHDYMTHDLSKPMRGFMNDLIDNNTFGHRLGPSGEQTRALVYLNDLDIVGVNAMRRQVAALCPAGQCWLAGSLVSYGELGERVLGVLYESLGISIALVALVLLWLCMAMRPKSFLPLVLSSIWGPAALLVVFYVFHVRVFYITSMIASILVGLTGDNAIQFLFASARKKNLQLGVTDVAPGAFVVTFCMIVTSTVFFFGYFDPMRTLGLMMIIGFALAFVGDVWILRGVSSRD
jgi:uncharacterized protein